MIEPDDLTGVEVARDVMHLIAADATSIDTAALRLLQTLTWPSAAVAVAFSPLGRALGSWLQALVPGPPPRQGAANQVETAMVAHLQALVDSQERIVAAQERISEMLERQQAGLQKILERLAVLLDRGPRSPGGDAGVA